MERNSQITDSLTLNQPHAPVYPLIASQITNKFQIMKGVAIEVGSGPASLSIAMARITELKIYAMDISPEMYKIAGKNIAKCGFKDRILPMLADVHQMPFPDNYAHLIFSRGSMFFWKDLASALKKIYAVLKPGGASYIGGGFGNETTKKLVKKTFKKQEENYESPPKIDIATLEIAVQKAEINNYQLLDDESGLWVLFEKSIE